VASAQSILNGPSHNFVQHRTGSKFIDRLLHMDTRVDMGATQVSGSSSSSPTSASTPVNSVTLAVCGGSTASGPAPPNALLPAMAVPPVVVEDVIVVVVAPGVQCRVGWGEGKHEGSPGVAAEPAAA
jgi:hypothetical protein